MPTHRIAHRIFTAIARIVTRKSRWVIGVYLVAALASVLITASRLELKTDQNDLVSSKLPYHQRYQEFLATFGDLEFLYVVIEVAGDPERAIAVIDSVVAEVSKLEDDVETIFYRVPPEAFGDSLLLLTPREDLEKLAAALEENLPLLRRVESVAGFTGLFDVFSDLLGDAPEDRRSSGEWGLRFLDACLGSVARAARGEDPPRLEETAGVLASGGGMDPRKRGYLFSSNGALAFVEILPRKNYKTLEVIEGPLLHIREALTRVRERFPGVQLGLTGRPVLAADEMRVTNDDMMISTILALVLVVGLFIFFFRRLRRPLLAAFSLMVAIAITFGVVTLTVGYLTLLSIVFTVMLVGLGIDFGVLFISRYQDELLATGDVEGSVRSTLLSTGMGIWTGGLCTSFVFYSALLVNFKGLAELGFVAGTGLLICLITMLTFLPALLTVNDRYIQLRRVLLPPRPITLPFLGKVARHPRTVLAIFAVLTAAGFISFRGIPYDWNLLNLQARGLESVKYELKIIEESDRSTWYAALIEDDMARVDQALASLRPWHEKGVVGDVESVRDVLPADQEEKARILRKAGSALAGFRVPAPSASLDLDRLASSLETLLDRLHHLQSLAASRPAREAKEAVKLLEGPISSVESIQVSLEDGRDEAARRIGAYQERWFRELGELKQKIDRLLDPPLITVASLPAEIRRRFVSGGEKARYLVYAYPRKDIWVEENMEEFIAAARAVDPDVTGVPVHFFESARLMRQGFVRAAIYSFLMVFAFLLIDFRSLKDACLTMAPVLLGLLWLFQLMPLLGLELNLANFFSLPILIGCAVDGAVHMVHRFRETGSTEDVGRSTGTAVCLASLSNMLGFASMSIARHQGAASLGSVTALGCATIMLAIIVFLPSLIEVIERGKLRPHGSPGVPGH